MPDDQTGESPTSNIEDLDRRTDTTDDRQGQVSHDGTPETDQDQVGTKSPPETEPETFPRDYVEQLRQENGKYRQRAQQANQLAQRLHAELVRSTGRLADPDDLPFDESHLEDADTLGAAIDALLTRKPHLAARRPTGEIGQGASGSVGSVDLAALLRQRSR